MCPTSGLQPSLARGRVGRVCGRRCSTPRLGYCDYSCNACGQACPTGAIPPAGLEDKRLAVIGHAYIDHGPLHPVGR